MCGILLEIGVCDENICVEGYIPCGSSGQYGLERDIAYARQYATRCEAGQSDFCHCNTYSAHPTPHIFVLTGLR